MTTMNAVRMPYRIHYISFETVVLTASVSVIRSWEYFF
jgi:hypothetical protein